MHRHVPRLDGQVAVFHHCALLQAHPVMASLALVHRFITLPVVVRSTAMGAYLHLGVSSSPQIVNTCFLGVVPF